MTNEWKLLLIAALFVLPVTAMIGIYVFRDAKRRGMKPGIWALSAMLVPGLIGFIGYLLERGKYASLLCPDCGRPIPRNQAVCAGCGAKFRDTCPACDAPVEADWKRCPRCETALPQEKPASAIPVKPKDHAFWVVLTALILAPLVLVLYSNLYIFDGMGEHYFLSRHNEDGSLRSGFVETEDFTQENWYGYTWTDCTTGETVTVRKEQKGYTVITADGEQFLRRGTGGGTSHPESGVSIPFDLIRESDARGNRTAEGRYYHDEAENLAELALSTGDAEYLRLGFVWTDGQIAEQRILDSGGDVRTYHYEDGLLVRQETCTADGELLETTRYIYARNGTIRTAVHHDADGNLTGTTVTTFDDAGNILAREAFDAENRLLSRTEFDYDHLSFLLRPYNLTILALVWTGLLALVYLLMLTDKPEPGKFVTQ